LFTFFRVIEQAFPELSQQQINEKAERNIMAVLKILNTQALFLPWQGGKF